MAGEHRIRSERRRRHADAQGAARPPCRPHPADFASVGRALPRPWARPPVLWPSATWSSRWSPSACSPARGTSSSCFASSCSISPWRRRCRCWIRPRRWDDDARKGASSPPPASPLGIDLRSPSSLAKGAHRSTYEPVSEKAVMTRSCSWGIRDWPIRSRWPAAAPGSTAQRKIPSHERGGSAHRSQQVRPR
jgi:hypothetical protein